MCSVLQTWTFLRSSWKKKSLLKPETSLPSHMMLYYAGCRYKELPKSMLAAKSFNATSHIRSAGHVDANVWQRSWQTGWQRTQS